MPIIRIDKLLSELGYGSRSEIKKYIRQGLVSVDGVRSNSSDTKIDTDKAHICFDGEAVAYNEFEYYILNKPAGYITATFDKYQPTVMELIPSKRINLSPVGRLDKDTEGFLLVTNDGQLSHRLLSPSHHVDKTYYAEISGKLPANATEIMADGIMLDGKLTLPARLEILDTSTPHADEAHLTCVTLTICEGRFHQVKEMFKALGCEVCYLKRISFAGLLLDDYAPNTGEYVKVSGDIFKNM